MNAIASSTCWVIGIGDVNCGGLCCTVSLHLSPSIFGNELHKIAPDSFLNFPHQRRLCHAMPLWQSSLVQCEPASNQRVNVRSGHDSYGFPSFPTPPCRDCAWPCESWDDPCEKPSWGGPTSSEFAIGASQVGDLSWDLIGIWPRWPQGKWETTRRMVKYW